MRNSNVIKQKGIYIGLWFIITSVSASIVIAGIGLGGLIPIGLQRYTPTIINYRISPGAGLFVIILGLTIWFIGTKFAFMWSIEKYSESSWDIEVLKNDIMYIMEDKISEMRQDLIEVGSKKE